MSPGYQTCREIIIARVGTADAGWGRAPPAGYSILFGSNYLISENFSVRQMPYGVLSHMISQQHT